MKENELLAKYNVPVPRYTSYPTVPYWKEGIDAGEWLRVFAKDVEQSHPERGISLYIHLPFCESLCTYCGCNKKITTNHDVEDEYIAAVHAEWEMYRSLMNMPLVRELHLGGGTPTFFSPANLAKLLQPILLSCELHDEHEFSFEGHPNNTTKEHLQALYDLGFRRVSFGVQDNDPRVQRIINRVQPFENVKRVTEQAREIGYTSVNFDLIYGLPLQTLESIQTTFNQVVTLRPDRIAFYSYAHVPWTSKGQRLFGEGDLPTAELKLALYLAGKRLLQDAGYHDVGMDHFALDTDSLYKAKVSGTLHRNFMGYTIHKTDILLGLGVSAISTTPGAHVQNDKTIHNYYAAANAGIPAVVKGIFLTEEDRRFGRYICDISCKGYARFLPQDEEAIFENSMMSLLALQRDGLVEIDDNTVTVTQTGKNFIRNIASSFDLYLARDRRNNSERRFSKAV